MRSAFPFRTVGALPRWETAQTNAVTLPACAVAVWPNVGVLGVVRMALRAVHLARVAMARSAARVVAAPVVLERREWPKMRRVAAPPVWAFDAERAGGGVAGVVDVMPVRNGADGEAVGHAARGRLVRALHSGARPDADPAVAARQDVAQPRPAVVGSTSFDPRPEPIGIRASRWPRRERDRAHARLAFAAVRLAVRQVVEGVGRLVGPAPRTRSVAHRPSVYHRLNHASTQTATAL